jgi:ABC-type transport system involved in multi-copper enzyme maturation permease subunit
LLRVLIGGEGGGLLYAQLMETLFVPSVVAFVALVLGASAMGDERDDGTVLYLASTPLPRRAITLAKLLAAWTVTLVLTLPGFLAALVITLGSDLTARAAVWSLLAVLGVTLAYTAVFVTLSLVVRRPVVVGFLYILLWEGSIASVAAAAKKFSIAAYGRQLVAEGLPGETGYNLPAVSAASALVALVAVAAVAAALAARRLARVELP